MKTLLERMEAMDDLLAELAPSMSYEVSVMGPIHRPEKEDKKLHALYRPIRARKQKAMR